MAKKKSEGFGKKWKKEQDRLGSFEQLPRGEYPSVCISAEVGPNKAKDGRNYVLEFEIIAGKYKGKKQKTWISIENPNQETVDIADKTIASLCDACGIKVEKFTDPKEPIKKKMNIVLTTTPGTDKYAPGNNISNFKEFDKDVKDPEHDEEENTGKKDKKEKKGKKGKKSKDKPF